MSSFVGVSEGDLLWSPSKERIETANITRYMRWLRESRGLRFDSYADLWQWSVTDLEGFWSSIWDFFGIRAHKPYTKVLESPSMPGARWFVGAELNYAEHALWRRDEHPAVLFQREGEALARLTYEELYRKVAAVQAALRRLGVRRGDRVAAYMPNIPQTLVAFLATVSLGAIWTSASPELGIRGVVDRFRQVEPKVVFVVDGYRYGGSAHPRLEAVREIMRRLPSVEATVLVPYLEDAPLLKDGAVYQWDDLIRETGDLVFEPVPFEHPLWILYSSGTTGLPKPIVHGHGAVVLEHLKFLSLHLDLGPDDRFFWFTTTSWVMWNILIGSLLVGATVVMFDGNPGYPDMYVLWQLAERAGVTFFGVSAPFIQACMKSGIEPGRTLDLQALRSVGSTGAPLPPEGFKWVYEHVKGDVLLASVSGGTDVCSAFVGSCPIMPVHAGEIQCRALGVRAEAYDEAGKPVVDQVGELVVTAPMPSMPIFFWNDRDGRRYRESYFEVYPGVWTHGDWVKFTSRGTCVIYGRSDATLKRGGVRMGASEFYRVVEEIPEVADSLVVDTSQLGREGKLLLFVALREGVSLDRELTDRIRQKLRNELSPRHVPDEIIAAPGIPRTLNGKKLEVPVRRILLGTPVEKAVNPDAMSNPEVMEFFATYAGSV